MRAHLCIARDDMHPAVQAKVTAVAASFERDIRRHGGVLECGHARQVPMLFVCAAHPAGGVRCPACATNHAERHSWELEHQCDGCGRLVTEESWSGVLGSLEVRGMPVRRARGSRGAVIGLVEVVCLAVCTDCYAPDFPTGGES